MNLSHKIAGCSLLLIFIIIGCSVETNRPLNVEVAFVQKALPPQVPVTFDLPENIADGSILWSVSTAGDGKRLTDAQSWQNHENSENNANRKQRISFIWEPETSVPPELRKFELKPLPVKVQSAFRFDDDGKSCLSLFEGEKPVFTYNYGMMLKAGVPEEFQRSSYIHPVYGLRGEVLTDDFPQDHYHHRGIFWSWPYVTVGEKTYDLWLIKGIHHRFEKWLGQEAGPVFARFGVENGWITEAGKVMREQVWVTVFKAGRNSRIIDFEFTWEPEGNPVTLLGADNKGYSCFSVRFAPFKDPIITTKDGIQKEDSDRLRFPWADLSAKFAGAQEYSGLAIFDRKENIGTPNTWTLRHYGFLNPAWPSLEKYTLNPGKPISVQYRVFIHPADAEQGKVRDAYSIYDNPPAIQVNENK